MTFTESAFTPSPNRQSIYETNLNWLLLLHLLLRPLHRFAGCRWAHWPHLWRLLRLRLLLGHHHLLTARRNHALALVHDRLRHLPTRLLDALASLRPHHGLPSGLINNLTLRAHHLPARLAHGCAETHLLQLFGKRYD